jgi:hypothetical protein
MLQVALEDSEINSLLSSIASAAPVQTESISYATLENLQDFVAGILKCQRALLRAKKAICSRKHRAPPL